MQDPTKYNKKYFMACATYYFMEHTFSHRYDDDDIVGAMEEIGVPDKYHEAVLKLVEEEDFKI